MKEIKREKISVANDYLNTVYRLFNQTMSRK